MLTLFKVKKEDKMLNERKKEILVKNYCIPVDLKKDYIIAIDEHSAMPTKRERRMLQSYREYVVRLMYRNAEVILKKDLPAIAGHNTVIFLKGKFWSSNGESGWCSRRASWTIGPDYFPCRETTKPTPPPWTLLQVLDKVTEVGGKSPEAWELWKKQHPKIFS